MRYCLAALLLLAVLPAMNVLAAPAPEPSAILDIGPPPKEKRPPNLSSKRRKTTLFDDESAKDSLRRPKERTAEEHRQMRIDSLTDPYVYLTDICRDPEVRKLPPVAALKDPRNWFSKNLRVTWEGEGNRLRLTFQAGRRDEQVVIVNSLLRAYIRRNKDERIKYFEGFISSREKNIVVLEKRIKASRDPQEVASYQKGINDLRSNQIPACRAEIALLKQITVIKWAK